MKIKSQDYEKFHKKLEDFCRYPMNLNDKFRLLLATTLRDDGLPDEREFDNQVINFTRVNHWRLIHFNFRISSFRKIVLTLLIYEIVYQLLYELFVGMVFSYAQHFFSAIISVKTDILIFVVMCFIYLIVNKIINKVIEVSKK